MGRGSFYSSSWQIESASPSVALDARTPGSGEPKTLAEIQPDPQITVNHGCYKQPWIVQSREWYCILKYKKSVNDTFHIHPNEETINGLLTNSYFQVLLFSVKYLAIFQEWEWWQILKLRSFTRDFIGQHWMEWQTFNESADVSMLLWTWVCLETNIHIILVGLIGFPL